MVLPLNYRRPSYVQRSMSTRTEESLLTLDKSDVSVRSGNSGIAAGIPSALSFDKIIAGGTCPPCTVRDFMNYLIYIERAAENLQFYLWHKDYVKRFEAASASERALAPEWTQAQEEEVRARIQKELMDNARPDTKAAQFLKGTDFEKSTQLMTTDLEKPSVLNAADGNPFSTPPRTPGEHLADGESVYTASNAQTHRSQASEAFTAAGVKQPFTIQPFRDEVDRVIATYIMDDAPRQLNLSAREQKAVLHALSATTHPSAFRSTARLVESGLRRQAHPNFIRWSICNGNPARVTFARGLGASLILLGIAAAVILTLSRAGRGWRALAAIAWVLGAATLTAAYKGMCVVLHGLHHRHVRPWELFVAEDEPTEFGKRSFDSLASSTNSYEDEPWIVRYKRRNVIRKIFDREIWIQEPMLRQIQDTIFVQSLLGAVLFGGVMCAIFVPLPAGNFF